SQGNGNFGSAQSFAVGATPIAIESGDFDDNGLVDLIVANNVSGDVSILLGNGNGGFQTGRFLSTNSGPRELAVADFDRDGCDDFAVVLPMARNSAVYYSNCAATFTRGTQTLASVDSPAAVAARDFTGDGIPDAMTSDQVDNSVTTFVKRANDRFFTRASADTYVVSRRPIALATADFDGDGRYDAATANSFVAGSASVLSNIAAPMLRRGDGNSDTRVTAADVVAVVREVGDGDGERVEEVPGSAVVSPLSVDANGDGLVNLQDTRGVAGWIF
ncbi:MAG TPA: VCBS repeat-containing protein, partial [Terriglobales bacterium]|nr:VCBS repeat-containing protein [Terriglobales bacterium]